jgi:isoprenylcysteine carboxyl methyltransferase (ICMT) family protein YpbQ
MLTSACSPASLLFMQLMQLWVPKRILFFQRRLFFETHTRNSRLKEQGTQEAGRMQICAAALMHALPTAAAAARAHALSTAAARDDTCDTRPN